MTCRPSISAGRTSMLSHLTARKWPTRAMLTKSKPPAPTTKSSSSRWPVGRRRKFRPAPATTTRRFIRRMETISPGVPWPGRASRPTRSRSLFINARPANPGMRPSTSTAPSAAWYGRPIRKRSTLPRKIRAKCRSGRCRSTRNNQSRSPGSMPTTLPSRRMAIPFSSVALPLRPRTKSPGWI